jgi:uncharacterized membrane protein (DUF441 family)
MTKTTRYVRLWSVGDGWVADKVWLDGEDVTRLTHTLISNTDPIPVFLGVIMYLVDDEGLMLVANQEFIHQAVLGTVKTEGFRQRAVLPIDTGALTEHP